MKQPGKARKNAKANSGLSGRDCLPPGSKPAEILPFQRIGADAGATGRASGPAGMGADPASIHEPGGDMLRQLLHPDAFTVFEQEFRGLPDEGMFDATPDRPFTFELGAVRVPKAMHLWLSDYRFGVMLLSGMDPGDFRIAEDGRFSGKLGFQLEVNGQINGKLRYQLDPVPIRKASLGAEPRPTADPFGPGRTPQSVFDRQAAQSFAAGAGTGLATLPNRRAVQGPENRNPWTWIVEEGQVVVLKCVIFRALTTPIGAIFGRVAGHELSATVSRALINRMRPK